MTLVNYSYGGRFAPPRGTGGMGDVSHTRFAFHKRSSFVGPLYWDSIYQTSSLSL